MKIQPYVNKLNTSAEYKTFAKKNNDAFMVAAFFVIDLENGKNSHVIDYYVPSKKKIAAFTLDNQITMQMMDLVTKKVPEKLDLKMNIDLDSLQGILEDEMKNRNITDELKKIIAVVQTVDGRKIWNLNCMLSGMGILNAHVEDNSRSVLRMEKKSFMDIVRKLPMEEIKKQMAAAQGANVQKNPVQEQGNDEEEEESQAIPAANDEQKAQIEKAIAAIEKEKAAIVKKEQDSKSSPKKSKKK
jgi:hypothetical protein